MRILMVLSAFFCLPAQAALRCDFQFSQVEKVCAHVDWVIGPSSRFESKASFTFFDPSTQQPFELRLDPKVSLFMPDMGHGSAPTKLVRPLGPTGQAIPGRYDVMEMFFSMPGVWEVRLLLKDAQGRKEQKSLTLDIQ